MNIKAYLADTFGCGFYRVMQPYSKLNVPFTGTMDIADLDDLNVMILQRADDAQVFKNMLYAKSKGCKVIYDIDDDLFNVDKASPAYEYYSHPVIQGNIKAFLEECDAITVSTEALKSVISSYTDKPIHVLPNCLDFANVWDKHLQNKSLSENIVIGWHGGVTHKGDILEIIDPLIQVLQENPDVHFKCIGYNFTKYKDFDPVRKQVSFVPGLPPNEFGKLLNFDIGIAPLADTEFNKSKSNVKLLEYSAMKIPVVASNVLPYQTYPHALLFSNPSEFYDSLTLLLHDDALCNKLVNESSNYCRTAYNLANNLYKWTEVLTSLI